MKKAASSTDFLASHSRAQMLKDYADRKPWFTSVASLVQADPRLAELSRDPESWQRARKAGVFQEKIDQYVHLLEQLGANETSASVYGIGKACLITADIVVGLFGTLDAIHLASLLVARSAVVGLRLLSLDERVRQAAKGLGVAVEPA